MLLRVLTLGTAALLLTFPGQPAQASNLIAQTADDIAIPETSDGDGTAPDSEGEPQPPLDEVDELILDGLTQYENQNLADAKVVLDQALEAARSNESLPQESFALTLLSLVTVNQGDYATAIEYGEQAIAVLENVDDDQSMVISLNVLDRKSTRLNSSHPSRSRMPSSA